MSYEISLVDPVTKETLEADFVHQITGGTYTVGGTRKLELNVTWNYCKFYYGDKAFGDKGIKSLDGMTGAESIPKRLFQTLETMFHLNTGMPPKETPRGPYAGCSHLLKSGRMAYGR